MQEKSTQALVICLVHKPSEAHSLLLILLGVLSLTILYGLFTLAALPETQQILRTVKRGLRTSTGLLYFDVCYQSGY